MARKVSVELVDDLVGGAAEETVRFALDGLAYEIDLTGDHAAQMRDALAEFVAAARRVGAAPRRGRVRAAAPARARRTETRSTASAAQDEVAEMRQWARANGFPVSERGRISREVQDAFRATPPEVRAEQAETLAALEDSAGSSGQRDDRQPPAVAAVAAPTFSSDTAAAESPQPRKRTAARKQAAGKKSAAAAKKTANKTAKKATKKAAKKATGRRAVRARAPRKSG